MHAIKFFQQQNFIKIPQEIANFAWRKSAEDLFKIYFNYQDLLRLLLTRSEMFTVFF